MRAKSQQNLPLLNLQRGRGFKCNVICIEARLFLKASCLLHRLFLSAEPPPQLERALPISLLQNSIKLTNEPPDGLKANLRRAYGQFNEEILEGCAKQAEFRSIIFALSYFHAALLERKKFGVGNLPAATSGGTEFELELSIQ